jgi:hypothetical protein
MKKDGSAPPDRQNEIAHGCSLTVVAESTPYLHRGNVIADAARSAFKSDLIDGHPVRYDLLAWPRRALLARDELAFDLLVGGIKTAIGLHNAERLLTVGTGADMANLGLSFPEVAELKRAMGAFCFSRVTPPADYPPRAAVLTCMDWRLHGPGRVVPACQAAFGFREAPAVLTVPGAAKLIADGSPEGSIIMDLVDALVHDGIETLYLVSHRDCGKYGGDAAFGGDAAQTAKLTADLAAATRRLNAGFPRLQVRSGIAGLNGDRVNRVTVV